RLGRRAAVPPLQEAMEEDAGAAAARRRLAPDERCDRRERRRLERHDWRGGEARLELGVRQAAACMWGRFSHPPGTGSRICPTYELAHVLCEAHLRRLLVGHEDDLR